jgi:hypothetical protein
MATGHLPFDGQSLPRLCVQVLEASFIPVATRCPDLPAAFAAAVERCLGRLPGDRYADIAHLAQALVPFAGPDGSSRAERCRAILAAANPGTPAIPSDKSTS